MGRIAGIVLFGFFLAGNAFAAAHPAGAAGGRAQIAGPFCVAPSCSPGEDGALGHGSAFAAATLAALWMSRRRD